MLLKHNEMPEDTMQIHNLAEDAAAAATESQFCDLS
jgi:hypothetical protein